jgi:hypothetical protein
MDNPSPLSVWKEGRVIIKGCVREKGDVPAHHESPIRVAAIGAVQIGAEVVREGEFLTGV